MRIEVACLKVTSWGGLVPGAHHWYGRIDGSLAEPNPDSQFNRFRELDVEYPLTKKDAKRHNQENEIRGVGYEVGEMSTRFYDRESMIDRATAFAKELGYHALFEGSYGTCQNQFLIYGPEMEQLNKLHRQFEALGGWDGDDEKEAEAIDKAWQKIARKAKIIDSMGSPEFYRR